MNLLPAFDAISDEEAAITLGRPLTDYEKNMLALRREAREKSLPDRYRRLLKLERALKFTADNFPALAMGPFSAKPQVSATGPGISVGMDGIPVRAQANAHGAVGLGVHLKPAKLLPALKWVMSARQHDKLRNVLPPKMYASAELSTLGLPMGAGMVVDKESAVETKEMIERLKNQLKSEMPVGLAERIEAEFSAKEDAGQGILDKVKGLAGMNKQAQTLRNEEPITDADADAALTNNFSKEVHARRAELNAGVAKRNFQAETDFNKRRLAAIMVVLSLPTLAGGVAGYLRGASRGYDTGASALTGALAGSAIGGAGALAVAGLSEPPKPEPGVTLSRAYQSLKK